MPTLESATPAAPAPAHQARQGVRAGWRAAFEHYIFGPDAPLSDHIPPERRGVLGDITPELARQIRAQLLGRLKS